jgi:hypothetical protein
MRDGHNGYLPSAGIMRARGGRGGYTAKGIPTSRTRAHHDGTSEAIDLV